MWKPAQMPRTCTICTHSELQAINGALVVGEAFRNIAKRYDTSSTALFRHKAEHLPATLVKGREAEEVARADDLLAQVRGLQAKALSILAKAEAAGDLRVALGAIREARGNLELLAKLLGELQDGQTVNVLVAPEWVSIRGSILLALERYPEARLAVVGALNGHSS